MDCSPPSSPPGDLPDPRIEPASPALADGFFTIEPPGKPPFTIIVGPIILYIYDI